MPTVSVAIAPPVELPLLVEPELLELPMLVDPPLVEPLLIEPLLVEAVLDELPLDEPLPDELPLPVEARLVDELPLVEPPLDCVVDEACVVPVVPEARTLRHAQTSLAHQRREAIRVRPAAEHPRGL